MNLEDGPLDHVRPMTPRECADYGLDWNEEFSRSRRERELAEQYGLSPLMASIPMLEQLRRFKAAVIDEAR